MFKFQVNISIQFILVEVLQVFVATILAESNEAIFIVIIVHRT